MSFVMLAMIRAQISDVSPLRAAHHNRDFCPIPTSFSFRTLTSVLTYESLLPGGSSGKPA